MVEVTAESEVKEVEVSRPWLLQKAKFKIKIDGKNTHGVDATLSFDYMGSAEYEYGALPKSCNQVIEKLDRYSIIKTEFKDVTGRELFFIGDRNVYEQKYKHYIPVILEGNARLKERTDMDKLYKPDNWDLERAQREGGTKYWYNKFNIAWDIKNNIFLIFSSKKYALAILEAFENTKKVRGSKEKS